MPDLDEKLKKTIDAFLEADARGSSSAAAHKEEISKLRKQIEKEQKKPPPAHPALAFGPIAQTISIMGIIALGFNMSGVMCVPDGFYCIETEQRQAMKEFAVMFTRITMVAVLVFGFRTAVIYYGYTAALATAAASAKKEEKSPAELKLAALLKGKPDRPDMWAHTRSHPSAFLTTRHTAPRIFPFPLGKTAEGAAIKEELWWEGGNPPHVGHFNRPKLPAPSKPGPDEGMLERVKKSMEIDAQRGLWSRRIRSIQILSGIVIVYFVSAHIAIIALGYLIYTTLVREIDNMLQPPMDWGAVYAYFDQITASSARNQSGPKSDIRKRIPPGGMTYIYDSVSAADGVVKSNTNVPIVGQVAPVLMTTQNHWYAGPGA